jgi:hypothetical protein
VAVASGEVAVKNHIRQQAPHQKKPMPEGALGAALSEALRQVILSFWRCHADTFFSSRELMSPEVGIMP